MIANTIVDNMRNFNQYVEPSLSPNGKKIVFVIGGKIYIRDLENSDPNSNTKENDAYRIGNRISIYLSVSKFHW